MPKGCDVMYVISVSIKLQSKAIEITLQRGCFPV